MIDRATAAALALLLVALPAPAVRADELPVVPPSEVGLRSSEIESIRPAMERLVEDGRLAGTVTLVARRGRICHLEAVGFRDLESREPMATDSIFRIYSMTKPITSVAVLMLVEEGRIALDDPLSKHLPEFAAVKVRIEGADVAPDREVTIRDLLRHTAGLTYGIFGDTEVDRLYRQAGILDPARTVREMAGRLAGLPLLFQPGTRWHYSVGVDLLGRLIEVASGESFGEFLEERILGPLDMKDTAFHVPEGRRDRLTTSYSPRGGSLEAIDVPATSRFSDRPRFESGGGGLVSTAGDYFRFAQMLLGGGALGEVRILKEETVALMTSDQLPEAVRFPLQAPGRNDVGFGLGLSVRVGASGAESEAAVGECGWGGAASTGFWFNPSQGLVAITMTQRMPFDGRAQNEVRAIVYRALAPGDD